jgi:hypothetical protein
MRTTVSTVVAVAFSALLTGCAAIDSVNKYIDDRDKKAEDERFEKATVACKRYGFAEGTDRFSTCLQTEVNNIKTREAIAESASKSSIPGPDNLPKTTNCIKTLAGMQCTTQ